MRKTCIGLFVLAPLFPWLWALMPGMAIAYPDVRLDRGSCHAVHNKEHQQHVTQLPGCEVTFFSNHARYFQPPKRIQFAVGRAKRTGLPADAVPFVPTVVDPNVPACKSRMVKDTYECWVFDRNGDLYLSGPGWNTTVKVCSEPHRDTFNTTYEVNCRTNRRATPEEVECVKKIVSGENNLNTRCP